MNNLDSTINSTPTTNPESSTKELTSFRTIKKIGAALSLSVALITGNTGCKTDEPEPTPTTEASDKNCPEQKTKQTEKNDNLNAEDQFLTAMIKYKGKAHEKEFTKLVQSAALKDPEFVLKKIAEYSDEFKSRQHLFLYTIEQLIKDGNSHDEIYSFDSENIYGAWELADRIIKIMRKKWGNEAAVTLKTAETKLTLDLLECQWIPQPNWGYYHETIPTFEDPNIRDELRIRLANNIEAKKHNTNFSYLSVEVKIDPTAAKSEQLLSVYDDQLTTTLDLIAQLETKDQKTKKHEYRKIILHLSIDIGDDFLKGDNRTKAMTQIMKILAQYPDCNRLTKPLQETYTLASKMDNPSLSGEQKQKIVEQVKDKLNKMYQELYDTNEELNFD